MIVAINMSREVYDYFKDYDLSQVADVLLDMYDFTNLPQKQGTRDVERTITVTNEAYISLYNSLGPRSKKVSLSRLFEFAYNMDILSHSRFNTLRKTTTMKDPTYPLVDRAYRALLSAQKHNDSDELKQITNLVYEFREVIKC